MQCTAFDGVRKLSSGTAGDVALAVKQAFARDAGSPILIFDDATGRQIDFDLRGTDAEIRDRYLSPAEKPAAEEEEQGRSAGRPKLGVVAREVTLLPRHWDWLNAQSGGASATLRKLVDAARAGQADADRMRLARESADGFMRVMAGDLPGYEEAARALYAGDKDRFETEIAPWPDDIRSHARELAAAGFAEALTPS